MMVLDSVMGQKSSLFSTQLRILRKIFRKIIPAGISCMFEVFGILFSQIDKKRYLYNR